MITGMELKRTLIGMSLWMLLLTVMGLVILTPGHRVPGLFVALPLGAVFYLSGEWLRSRRRTR